MEKTSTKSGTSAALVVLKCSLLVEEDIKSAMIIEHATKIGIIMNKVAISLFSSVSDFVRVSEANLEILRFLDYTIAVITIVFLSEYVPITTQISLNTISYILVAIPHLHHN